MMADEVVEELAADGDVVPPGEIPPSPDDPEALEYLQAHGWPSGDH
jgi:hypothetical protein